MTGRADKPTREERLAAQLRANLHRRKAQSRALEAGDLGGAKEELGEDGLPNEGERG